MIGTTLSHYKITAKLGEGGMGEVYRAEDTRLKREVALKILPKELAGSQERLERFQREAEVLASLDHPHIVTIYSVEEADGVRFLTMQLVEGRTVAALIPGGGMPLEQILQIAVPLADALAAAHDEGIIHRDIKPENVMITSEGRVKVLDFGLAKVMERREGVDLTDLPTETLDRVTREGQVMGTLPYMAPEQLRGGPPSPASDIFALGAVLYELATGERPFTGPTNADLASSILRDRPPPVSEIRSDLPLRFAQVVDGCLEKDPDRRTQSAHEVRDALERLPEAFAPTSSGATAESSASRRWSRPVVVALGVAIVVAVVIASWLLRPPDGVPAPPRIERVRQLTSMPGLELFPALSPDARFVAFAGLDDGDWDVYLLRIGGANPINLTAESDADDIQPTFSPAGDQIAFRSDRDGGGIFVMGATGESVRRLSQEGFDPAWSPDGTEIAYARGAAWSWQGDDTLGLEAVRVDSGRTRVIAGEIGLQPSWSPRGDRIAAWDSGGGRRNVLTIPAAGGSPTSVTATDGLDWNPVWAPTGDALYFLSDRAGSMSIWRVLLDESSGELRGEPELVTIGSGGEPRHLSVSADGRRLVYANYSESQTFQRVTFDPSTGEVGQPTDVLRTSEQKTFPSISPDGSAIAFKLGQVGDIALMRPDGSGRRLLTDDSHRDQHPRWSPDGTRIAFFSNRSGSYEIWTIRPDGSDLRQLTEAPTANVADPVWSPDGSRMAYIHLDDRRSFIMDLSESGTGGELRELPPVGGDQAFAVWSWSPDGTQIAGHFYDGAGSTGIGLYSVETGSYTKLIDYGAVPAWLKDGRQLVFYHDGELHIVDIDTGASRVLLRVQPGSIHGNFSIDSDDHAIYFTRIEPAADLWLLDLAQGN